LRGWLVGDERGDEFGEFSGGEVVEGGDVLVEDVAGVFESLLSGVAGVESVEDAQEFVSCIGLEGFEVCAEVESAGAEDGSGLESGERVAERFVVDVGFDACELVGFDGALRVGEGGGGAIEVVGFVCGGGGDVDAELVAEVKVEVEGGDEFAVFSFMPPLALRELFEEALDSLLHAVPAIHGSPPVFLRRISSKRAALAN